MAKGMTIARGAGAVGALAWLTATAGLAPAHAAPGNVEVRATSGMCLTVGNNASHDGMWMIQYRCTGKSNQKFTFEPTGAPDQYRIRVHSTGMYMVPRWGSTAEHAEIVQSRYSGHPAFAWQVENNPNGTVKLRNVNSGFCMGVAWDRNASGQPVDQATCGAFGMQSWRVSGLGVPPPPPPPPPVPDPGDCPPKIRCVPR